MAYANTRFKKSVNEWGRVEGWIEPGDKVTQTDLGVSDDKWKELIEAGVIVDKYPEALKKNPQLPPAEYYRDHANDDAPDTEPVKEKTLTPVAPQTTGTTTYTETK